MFTKTYSATLRGIEANIIDVEIDVSKGIPGFNIVGLADKSINEAKERINVAMRALDFEIHPKRILVNLSPAQDRKEGAQFDLAIAAALMVNFDYIEVDSKFLEEFCLLGELSLTGDLKAITGTLSFLLEAAEKKFKYLVIPKINSQEAALVTLKKNFTAEIFAISDLHELKILIEALYKKNHTLQSSNDEGLKLISTCIQNYKIPDLDFKTLIVEVNSKKETLDLDDVIGQAHAKRALEIAAAGRHHLLMIGPPGCGKSMLAKRFVSLLPDLDFDAALDTTRIYNISNCAREKIILSPPLRSPHHSASAVSLTGGGIPIKPGEVSLAHNGVLFLDELTEFNRCTIDQLRQILEEKSVIISRAKQSLKYPANFILITACNPCPCGYLGDEQKPCTCSMLQISKYISKLSGPFLDRIDLHIELNRLSAKEISKLTDRENSNKSSENVLGSSTIKERVSQTREFLKIHEQAFHVNQEAREFIDHIVFNSNLSARSHQKILKVAKTIAALENNLEIEIKHIAEAMQYRSVAWEKYRK